MTDANAAVSDPNEGSASTPEELARQQAAFWIDEINSYDKEFDKWRTRVKKIVKKYRDERLVQTDSSGTRKYCILWSNVETIKPAIYARPPKAVVGRRWKDKDPVGRLGAMILERAENFSIDCYDLDGTMKEVVQDYLLGGRGQIWLRYEPRFKQVPGMASETASPVSAGAAETTVPPINGTAPAAAPAPKDEQGNAVDELDYEQTCRDYVHWDDFGHSTSRVWKEVWWVSRRTFQTRRQLVTRFGKELGDKIPLDYGPERNPVSGRFEKRNKAAIYEIWSKRDRKVYFISKGYPDGPLEVRDPMYRLNDFFPCPRPCYASMTTDCLVPIPDYVYYQDQAEEIDDLTARIGRLTDSLKLVGVYNGAGETNIQLGRMLSPTTDNVMIPVENWAMFADGKGIAGQIDWFPVDMVIKVLEGCIKLRAQLIQDIYQITGISDIVRGASDPGETATAQEIKNRWGGLRVRDRQSEIQRFARDVIRIETEIVAQQYQPETLAAMTGVQLPTADEKAQVQQDMMLQQRMAEQQAAMQPPQVGPDGQPIEAAAPPAPPEPDDEQKKILASPTWEDVMGLLRSNELRDFRIDVETDSTIQPDEAEEKEKRTELLEVVGKFTQAIGMTPPALIPVMNELLLFTVRAFHAGNSVEDAIDEAMASMGAEAKQAQMQPPPPDPAMVKAESDVKVKQVTTQADIENDSKRTDADIINKGKLTQAEIETKRALAAEDHRIRLQASEHDLNTKRQGAEFDRTDRMRKQAEKAPKPSGSKRVMVERDVNGRIIGATVAEEPPEAASKAASKAAPATNGAAN